MNKGKLVEKLKQNYAEIFLNMEKPSWAVRKKSIPSELVHPPIPYVGEDYEKTKLLLYASAENLTYYVKELEYLDRDNIAINRHRYCFEKFSDDKFFPNVHIEPVSNGALLVIVAYILYKIYGKEFKSPYDLVNNIAIANFCKFSINSESKNIDYAKDRKKLIVSIDFVKTDLKILKPEIVIIPKTIHGHREIKSIMKNVEMIIPIVQVTPKTINCHLHKKYKKKKKIPVWIKEWHEKLPDYGAIRGKTKDNYYSVYSYLDEILNNLEKNER